MSYRINSISPLSSPHQSPKKKQSELENKMIEALRENKTTIYYPTEHKQIKLSPKKRKSAEARKEKSKQQAALFMDQIKQFKPPTVITEDQTRTRDDSNAEVKEHALDQIEVELTHSESIENGENTIDRKRIHDETVEEEENEEEWIHRKNDLESNDEIEKNNAQINDLMEKIQRLESDNQNMQTTIQNTNRQLKAIEKRDQEVSNMNALQFLLSGRKSLKRDESTETSSMRWKRIKEERKLESRFPSFSYIVSSILYGCVLYYSTK